MKGFKSLVCASILLVTMSSAWALKTKFDPTIFENDLKLAGIKNVAQVQSDLGLKKDSKDPQELVIKHVITTGRAKADRNYMLIDIKTLEGIKPPVASYKIIHRGKQIALTEAQVESAMSLMQPNDTEKKWLSDKRKPKYINIVLQAKDGASDKISPVTASEASALVKWAIKHDHLDKEDHPEKAG